MPEFAANDFDVIRARLTELREGPKCPRNPALTLETCLHSATQCAAECEFHDRWVGPDTARGVVGFAAREANVISEVQYSPYDDIWLYRLQSGKIVKSLLRLPVGAEFPLEAAIAVLMK